MSEQVRPADEYPAPDGIAENATPPGVRWARLKGAFAALRHRNYRLWFYGQLVSLFGTWMQTTAQGFLVYELTGSPAYLGYVGFAAGLPTWLFTLYGGVVADRLSRRTLLVITQTVMMTLAFILAALAFLGLVRPWQILLMAVILGTANAFDAPARHAFVPELVPREDLANAIALNSTMFNTATALGPAAAGLVYAVAGPAWCFVVNGLTYLAIIAALFAMGLERKKQAGRRPSAMTEIAQGIRYVFSQRAVRALIAMVGMTSLCGISFATLMPAWAVRVLGGDATTNGLLQSARSLGALGGAVTIAVLGRFKFKGRLMTSGLLAFPVLLAIFSLTGSLPISLALLVCTGASVMLVLNLANALVQSLIPDELRGRVMGIYSLTFLGVIPLGSLIFGTLAEHAGERAALLTGAVLAMAAAILMRVRAPWLKKLE